MWRVDDPRILVRKKVKLTKLLQSLVNGMIKFILFLRSARINAELAKNSRDFRNIGEKWCEKVVGGTVDNIDN